MVYFYCGVPGSGKSLHLAKTICEDWLFQGKNVICVNMKLNEDEILNLARSRGIDTVGTLVCVGGHEFLENAFRYPNQKKSARADEKPNKYSYIEGLYGFAENFHRYNEKLQYEENQTLVAISECEDFFDNRAWNRSDRIKWVEFFRMHRHYGFDCILESQTDKGIDKKIQAVLQTKVEHRDYIHYKGFWKMFAVLRGGHAFLCVETLYALKNNKLNHLKSYFNSGYEAYYNIYDSFETTRHIKGKVFLTEEQKEKIRRDEIWAECVDELLTGVYAACPEPVRG